MSRTKLAIIGVVVVVLGVIAFNMLFTVHQAQQALILQFGNPVRVERDPGLKFKLPFIQNVEYFDKRILDLDPPVTEVILNDQKRINVDSFARYRILDPLEFRKRARTTVNFRDVFGRRLNAAVRSEVAKVSLADMLSERRAGIMGFITEQLKSQAPEFGVEVVDVRIGRTDLPEATSQAVYNRMRSDRVAQAAELRAQGEEQKARIQAGADRERTVILAEANRQAQILRGDGEAERTRLLIDAFGRDQEFFDLYRRLEALSALQGEGTTMVLTPETDILELFSDRDGRSTPPGQ